MGKIKWFLVWALLYSLSLLVTIVLFQNLNIKNYFVTLILAALLISTLSKIYKTLMHNERFNINYLVLYSIAMNFFNVGLFKLLLSFVNLESILVSVLLGGLLFETVWQVSHKVKKKAINLILFPAVLIVLLLVTNFYVLNQDYHDDSFNTGNILEKGTFSITPLFKLPSDLLAGNCPQIKVPMSNGLFGLNIAGTTYDGWIIKGEATCKRGSSEGENTNYYYCGGYKTEGFGVFTVVNAYVEKTTISKTGNIGKTYKYIIWNVYDENQQFVETRCLGDPDDFEKKQVDALVNLAN